MAARGRRSHVPSAFGATEVLGRVNEIVARIQAEAFDDLDGPIGRIGAAPGISPQAESLEKSFLPTAADIAAAVTAIF